MDFKSYAVGVGAGSLATLLWGLYELSSKQRARRKAAKTHARGLSSPLQKRLLELAVRRA